VQEQRCLDVRYLRGRNLPAVVGDRGIELRARCGEAVDHQAAEAEAEGEHGTIGIIGPEEGHRGRGVGGYTLQRGERDMIRVGEVLVASPDAGAPAEIVYGHCVISVLGETERQLDVEMMKATDVGKDDHSRALGTGAGAFECGELVAIGRSERQVVMT